MSEGPQPEGKAKESDVKGKSFLIVCAVFPGHTHRPVTFQLTLDAA